MSYDVSKSSTNKWTIGLNVGKDQSIIWLYNTLIGSVMYKIKYWRIVNDNYRVMTEYCNTLSDNVDLITIFEWSWI